MPRPLLRRPESARFIYAMAHGAGAGSRHPFLAGMADALAVRDVATLRWDLPYMAAGRKSPDRPEVAHASVRTAVARAAKTGLPVIAGGKSFGGRMSSQAQALAPMPGVVGLVFLGFPLHPPGKPGTERADHLAAVKVPMLFLQGTRDEFAELRLLEPVVASLPTATLVTFAGADHGFRGVSSDALADAIVSFTSRFPVGGVGGS